MGYFKKRRNKLNMDDTNKNIEPNIKDIQEIQDIFIAIDSWDDIFSDFDPSPLSSRVLSEDFLMELKKRHRETQTGNFVITLYAPSVLKDEEIEKIVIKRLKQYFKFRYLSLTKEINLLRLKGGKFAFFGILSLILITLVTYFQVFDALTLELLGIVFMPLGWFGIWEGFSRLIEPSSLLKQDAELFNKLLKSNLKFKYI
jgi:hypothetical protein